nr:putative ribonuclease H-like domain-containing protein [Tanacetum cinerariifolium]
MPMAMPVSTREPKQFVEKPIRKTVDSKSNQKLRNTFRKLYERVRKACSWCYIKFTPSGYIWKPKSKIGNVNSNVSMPLGNASRTVNVLDTQTSRLVQRGLHTQKGFFTKRQLLVHLKNGVVERRNRTLAEAARTMLSAAKVPIFFWTEAIAIICFPQKRSLVILRHEKTPYHIMNDRKPKKCDAYIFVGYSTQPKDHISSDLAPECQGMALEHDSLSPRIQCQENVPHVVSKSSAGTTADAPNHRQQ